LFNRLYQPDIDLVRLSWSNDVSLSNPGEIRLGLLWLSLLAGRLPRVSLAAGTGVETSSEVIKYLLAGADAVDDRLGFAPAWAEASTITGLWS